MKVQVLNTSPDDMPLNDFRLPITNLSRWFSAEIVDGQRRQMVKLIKKLLEEKEIES